MGGRWGAAPWPDAHHQAEEAAQGRERLAEAPSLQAAKSEAATSPAATESRAGRHRRVQAAPIPALGQEPLQEP
jgi:hypothetical protein